MQTRRHEDTKATNARKPQITQIDADGFIDAAVPRIDGGNVGDLAIADYRLEARQLRTRAFVAAMLPTGRRARGASIPPALSQIGSDPGPSLPFNREEKW